jgi:hypothetical protein
MIEEKIYLEIAKTYGKITSWSVGKGAGSRPKSNISKREL